MMTADLGKDVSNVHEWLILNNAADKEIFVLAVLVLLSLIVIFSAKKYKIPIVVGYVFLGILLSVDVIDWLPFLSHTQKEWYKFSLKNISYITNIALGFIAFTIGSELSIKLLKKMGKTIVYIVLLEASGAFALVFLAVIALGKPIYIGLLLGGIAAATAPAATVMVLKEYKAEGPLTSMIMAIVGIDDAIALILFSIVEPIAYSIHYGTKELTFLSSIGEPLFDIIFSIILGLGLGYIGQKIISTQEDKTKKIMTFVTNIIVAIGLSIYFNLSPLITNMVVGFAYRNFSRKNLGITDYIETMTIPIYAVFFILAGTEIRLSSIASLSFLVLAFTYLFARMAGKLGGAYLGALLGKAPEKIKKYVGFGLFPQSGVAIALAYIIQKDFASDPRVGLLIFNTLLFTAALTEVIGPFATKYAVFKAGEAKIN
ncbi:MAG: cation:proton antiporter [Halanaerobiales bacterium]|nr:cation:proton antiporter [Halanaerobiales bacterium]